MLHVTGPPAAFIISAILSDVAVGHTFPGKKKINLRLDVYSLRDLFHKCFVPNAEFTEQPREEGNGEDNHRLESLVQLEGVASGGRFVIFVALQGEGGNADIEVGTISPFDAERPPKDKCKMRSMLREQQSINRCITSTRNR